MPLVVKSVDFDVWCLGLRVADYGPVDEHDGMVVSCADCVMAVVGHPCIDGEDVGFLIRSDHKGYVKNFIMLRNLSEWLFETAQRRIRAVFLYIILELERDLTKSITDLSVSQTASSLGI